MVESFSGLYGVRRGFEEGRMSELSFVEPDANEIARRLFGRTPRLAAGASTSGLCFSEEISRLMLDDYMRRWSLRNTPDGRRFRGVPS